MEENESRKKDLTKPGRQIGFLLSQVGAASAYRFAELIRPLGLSPSHAGILRLLARARGLSQRELATKLSMLPSRLVVLIDELEGKGLVERNDDPADRRSYSLSVTGRGAKILSTLGEAAQKHSDEMCKGLTAEERKQLAELLSKVAETQGLVPGVHPGYKRMGGN
jgi:DNA-binding MarR family transcriptional regulator